MFKNRIRIVSAVLLLLALMVGQLDGDQKQVEAAKKEYDCYGTYVLRTKDSYGRGTLRCVLKIEPHSEYCGDGCIGLHFGIEVEGLFGDHKYDTYQGGDLIRTGKNKYKSVDTINNLNVSFKVISNKKIRVAVKGQPYWSYFKKPNGTYKLKTRPDYRYSG